MSPDTITILRSLSGRPLAKAIDREGRIFGFSNAKTIDLYEVKIADLNALEVLLHRLEPRRDCAVVRAAVADPSRTRDVRRLLYRDPETGDEPTLCERARRWVALDIDGMPIPAVTEPEELGACAQIAIECLPAPFRRARCLVQPTASHGLKPGVRIRLWYWLSRPTSGAELKFWLRAAPVDRSIFGPAQLVYTAAPVFMPGAFDPLPSRFATLPGADAVTVPRVLEPPRPKPRIDLPSDAGPAPREIAGLLRSVAQAAEGNRNATLYWASRRLAEKPIDREFARLLLEDAALEAGLSPPEGAATVRSGLRHRGA